ncbi:MAG: hypothetical protein ACREXP_21810 [Steroidobacteraceae bacterium]
MDIDPRGKLGQSMRPHLTVKGSDGNTEPALGKRSKAERQFVDAQEIIRRAVDASRYDQLAINWNRRPGSYEQYATVEPREFLAWASDKGYQIPEALKPIVADKLSRADELATPAAGQKEQSPQESRTTSSSAIFSKRTIRFARRPESIVGLYHYMTAAWRCERRAAMARTMPVELVEHITGEVLR